MSQISHSQQPGLRIPFQGSKLPKPLTNFNPLEQSPKAQLSNPTQTQPLNVAIGNAFNGIA